MDEAPDRAALLSALTTEHFVLQTANSATYTEASARSTLYVMALSSALVAMGFLAETPRNLLAFAFTVLPALFVLGLFTVMRLVETSLESMHYLAGIAAIRGHYRKLGRDAAQIFSAEAGRWPEVSSPAERLGPLLAFMGTTASMIAVINNMVAGAVVALAVSALMPSIHAGFSVGAGLLLLLALSVGFHAYQRWRFADYDAGKARAPDVEL
ncbi:MAG: hypothetical protein EOO25_07210 [Comamonadaceae bacterium]|nr:MAG: hypothetical protein EOO25_07210 [Comamonadaceae bacterium]